MLASYGIRTLASRAVGHGEKVPLPAPPASPMGEVMLLERKVQLVGLAYVCFTLPRVLLGVIPIF